MNKFLETAFDNNTTYRKLEYILRVRCSESTLFNAAEESFLNTHGLLHDQSQSLHFTSLASWAYREFGWLRHLMNTRRFIFAPQYNVRYQRLGRLCTGRGKYKGSLLLEMITRTSARGWASLALCE